MNKPLSTLENLSHIPNPDSYNTSCLKQNSKKVITTQSSSNKPIINQTITYKLAPRNFTNDINKFKVIFKLSLLLIYPYKYLVHVDQTKNKQSNVYYNNKPNKSSRLISEKQNYMETQFSVLTVVLTLNFHLLNVF